MSPCSLRKNMNVKCHKVLKISSLKIVHSPADKTDNLLLRVTHIWHFVAVICEVLPQFY